MLREVSIFALKLNFELHLMIIAVKYSVGNSTQKVSFQSSVKEELGTRSKMADKDLNKPKNAQKWQK